MENKQIGRFGPFGGQYVPETLITALQELNEAYVAAFQDESFIQELEDYYTEYVGRPSRLYLAKNLTQKLGGPKIYLKREDLNHTGAHKLNNALGQALLAKRMGKKRIVVETGAGQHGVASATVAALFGLECKVFMGAEDVERQALNVFRMRLLGTEVVSVTSGSCTLKDAVNEVMRYWAAHVDDTFYVNGSVVGPHPYPSMVRDFQRVIGREARRQVLKKEGRLPDAVVACVGGGSNAMGMFHDFVPDAEVALYGVEAAGEGLDTLKHAATLCKGSPGILHGAMTYLLQNQDGQVLPAHSVSAGLDYPGVGPEHAYLKESGRVTYAAVTDDEALSAFALLSRTEGIIPALESSHAVAYAVKLAQQMTSEQIMLICLSGRGDKDVAQVAERGGIVGE